MKKLLLCTAALAMFAGSTMALNGNDVKAAGNAKDSPTSDSTTTLFKIDNKNAQTSPVNPNNPNSILDNPEDHNINPNNAYGELKIDAVPTTLDFKDNAGNNNNLSSTIKSGEENPNTKVANYYYTQVSDFRDTNKPKGWTLTANMSNMTLQNDNTSKLLKANITFNNKKSETNDGTKAYSAYSSEGQAPNAHNNLTLQPEQTEDLMTADPGSGSGTWFDYFDSITLNAARSTGGQYQGTITWNLTSGADNNGINKGNNNSNS